MALMAYKAIQKFLENSMKCFGQNQNMFLIGAISKKIKWLIQVVRISKKTKVTHAIQVVSDVPNKYKCSLITIYIIYRAYCRKIKCSGVGRSVKSALFEKKIFFLI